MDCFESPPRPTKRVASPVSVTNKVSAKRRRVSLASVDFARELKFDHNDAKEQGPTTVADRFISRRPRSSLPLNTTPRTNRIAKSFDLADDRVLTFADAQASSSNYKLNITNQINMVMHNSASQLYAQHPVLRPTSVTSNLATHKQSIMALDTPGIPVDTFANPISWSHHNCIAVTCNDGVYYQNLDTKIVRRLATPHRISNPANSVLSLQWAGKDRENLLAIGTTGGELQVWEAWKECSKMNMMVEEWEHAESARVTGLSWNGPLLTVGRAGGTIDLYDIRDKDKVRSIDGHKSTVAGVTWNPDGKFLACGDKSGVVHIWDARASKDLWSDVGKRSSKIRHRGPVKALAWCPWDTNLLATGSTFPEGKIRVFNATNLSSPPTPVSTLSLNTSILSLHWSPHCRELLSTQGSSFEPPKSLIAPRGGIEPSPSEVREAWRSEMIVRKSACTNSILVHAYPGWKRLLTIPCAHPGVVAHSCLSPDGTKIFTGLRHSRRR
ncbi:hypothetical protein ONZ45_g16053 [Pleurotus djamor]|nr:hypothetical protein ONZ45_g16053 [Pleurotus djamor]